MNNSLNLALSKASRNLCIDKAVVERVYRSYWGFIRSTIESLPLREMSIEEFAAANTNFNLPYIGKLYADYSKVQSYKRQYKYYLENVKSKKDKANRKSDTCNEK